MSYTSFFCSSGVLTKIGVITFGFLNSEGFGMKKVIVIVVGLLSLLTSLYASRASFVVSNEELFYSYDTIVNESIAEDRIVNLELTNSDVVIFSDSTK